MPAYVHVQDKAPAVEQAMECTVMQKATKGAKGEHWLFLVMPDGKKVLLRVGDCRAGEVREDSGT